MRQGRTSSNLEKNLDKTLLELAGNECGGSPSNKTGWHQKRWEERKRTKDQRCLFYCRNHHQSKCQFRLAVIRDANDDCQTFISNEPRVDHGSQLPGTQVASITVDKARAHNGFQRQRRRVED